MLPVLLIDGDQFIFRATAAVEKETLWDDQNHVLYSNENEAWDNLTGMLERIFERFGSREHALTFSSPPNFRLAVDATYKNNRAARKPLCYAALRERVEGEYNVVAMTGLEADDVMGILATKPGAHERIIVSIDKDMRTVPSTIWNGEDLVKVSEAEANYFHLYQTLIGDTSDGYKGCPGIGPKKAEALLAQTPSRQSGVIPKFKTSDGKPDPDCTRCWEKDYGQDCVCSERGLVETISHHTWRWALICAAFVKAGLTPEHALTQARLARILRWTDWDSEKKEPILWSPSGS